MYVAVPVGFMLCSLVFLARLVCAPDMDCDIHDIKATFNV